jgi:hypothetical protein
VEIKWSDLVVKDARKLKSFIQYIKQNKIQLLHRSIVRNVAYYQYEAIG